jgi:hypothetical protein
MEATCYLRTADNRDVAETVAIGHRLASYRFLVTFHVDEDQAAFDDFE